MKIGIFDSGLGGLFVMRSIVKMLPQYDYIYYGDTKRVPYGNRSHETILEFTKEALEFLFKKNCSLVILACNSASAQALREIQKKWLPRHYPNKKVLGVIIPTVEDALDKNPSTVGVLGTIATVDSKTFEKEITKRNKKVRVLQQAAPLLVPLVEADEIAKGDTIIKAYIKKLHQVDVLILGCTHYGILKNKIQKHTKKKTHIVSQNTIIPHKLADYLRRHPKIERRLTHKQSRVFYATEITPNLKKQAAKWFGKKIRIQRPNK